MCCASALLACVRPCRGKAFDEPDPFVAGTTVHEDVRAAIAWQAARSDQQIQDAISLLEATAMAMRQTGGRTCPRGVHSHLRNGSCAGRNDEWFSRCDGVMRAVCKDVNGLLLEHLLGNIGHCDRTCADLFRNGSPCMALVCVRVRWLLRCTGAPLTGLLERSGIGEPVDIPHAEMGGLESNLAERNQAALERIFEDDWHVQLHELTVKDARAGRMTMPIEGLFAHVPCGSACMLAPVLPACECDLGSMRLHPRFAVAQGVRWACACRPCVGGLPRVGNAGRMGRLRSGLWITSAGVTLEGGLGGTAKPRV